MEGVDKQLSPPPLEAIFILAFCPKKIRKQRREDNMFELLTKPLAEVRPGVPSLIQEKWFIKFSDSWDPARTNVVGQRPSGGTYGKFFQVVVTNQVPYDIPYIIPANDYRDVDFSDSATIGIY